ncbi:MAG TPA: ribbon-helix-helix protein, CopG family [Aggregatilineales bacterium]|nr:ribbon-helix-helix protein, CopG family [Aggregatilineales bacterium]
MSDLTTSFTFRLTDEDKSALSELAERLGCDRGAALRRFIRQASRRPAPRQAGQFTVNGHVFPLKLGMGERRE